VRHAVAVTSTTAPFWDGLRRREVRLQRCTGCDAWLFYPRAHCPTCLGRELEWHRFDGSARLLTWTITRRATAPEFEAEVPQQIAVVELERGARMITTLVDTDGIALREGLPLEPVFDDDSANVTLLRFRPAQVPRT
jgi:uncharacterized OB-fold protein